MATTDHIVLPVSALKPEATRVFDALAAGRTVYVSKHGNIVAAFRPFDDLPESVPAAYATPGAITSEITARDLQQAVPSKAVADAVDGLPSLVTKNHEIYGVLTAASTPLPTVIPDLNAAAARAEAVRRFIAEHPGASVDDIAAMRSAWEENAAGTAAVSAPASVEEPVADWSVTEALDDLDTWSEQGSKIESFVRQFLELMGRVLQVPKTTPAPSAFSAVSALSARAAVCNDVYQWRSDVLGTFDDPSERVIAARPLGGMREGARIAGNNPVLARQYYVQAVVADPTLNTGAMWSLGDLARCHGNVAEARAWYGMAMNWREQLQAERADATAAKIRA